jgi:hypothetical protein
MILYGGYHLHLSYLLDQPLRAFAYVHDLFGLPDFTYCFNLLSLVLYALTTCFIKTLLLGTYTFNITFINLLHYLTCFTHSLPYLLMSSLWNLLAAYKPLPLALLYTLPNLLNACPPAFF